MKERAWGNPQARQLTPSVSGLMSGIKDHKPFSFCQIKRAHSEEQAL